MRRCVMITPWPSDVRRSLSVTRGETRMSSSVWTVTEAAVVRTWVISPIGVVARNTLGGSLRLWPIMRGLERCWAIVAQKRAAVQRAGHRPRGSRAWREVLRGGGTDGGSVADSRRRRADGMGAEFRQSGVDRVPRGFGGPRRRRPAALLHRLRFDRADLRAGGRPRGGGHDRRRVVAGRFPSPDLDPPAGRVRRRGGVRRLLSRRGDRRGRRGEGTKATAARPLAMRRTAWSTRSSP